MSRVPSPERVGRSDVFLSSVSEATRVLEPRKSISGETLYRAADRRVAIGGSRGVRTNTVTTWNEVRRLAATLGNPTARGPGFNPTVIMPPPH